MYKIVEWTLYLDQEVHNIGGGRVVHVASKYTPTEIQIWTEEDDKGRPTLIPAKVKRDEETFNRLGVPVGTVLMPPNEAGLVVALHVIAYPQNRNLYSRIQEGKL